MPRDLPTAPHPSARIAEADGKPSREWWDKLDELFKALVNRVPVTGSVTFAAATTAAVTFATAEADANYTVTLDAPANRTYWVSNKTTAGFTINASASNSDTVQWMKISS